MDEPISETAKAVQEVAKTAGKGIDAAARAGGFLAKITKEPLEVAMDIWTDKLRYYRWERQLDMMQRAEQKIAALGGRYRFKPLPLNIAAPILEASSLEEDAVLRDCWANMLTNGTNDLAGAEMRRAYVSIFEQMTNLDVRVMTTVYALPFDQTKSKGVVLDLLPGAASIADDKEKPNISLDESLEISLANLDRLGCLQLGMTWGGGHSYHHATTTALGRQVVLAFSPP